MAYLLSSICTKNYWNRTAIVEIIVNGWVVSFLETQCTYTDAAYCYQPSSVVCLSVSLSVTSEPCANGPAKKHGSRFRLG